MLGMAAQEPSKEGDIQARLGLKHVQLLAQLCDLLPCGSGLLSVQGLDLALQLLLTLGAPPPLLTDLIGQAIHLLRHKP